MLGVSEQTVARRYRKLRSAGVIRVVGGVDGSQLGYTSWTIRLRTTPDASGALGAALARRADTFYVHLLSGGTEISCFTQARLEDGETPLLEKLPRTGKVLAMSAHSLLRGLAIPGGWAGLAWLKEEQATQLRFATTQERRVRADAADHALLDALATDGRTGYPDLAAATGWSESTVRRRLDQLRRSGALLIQLEFDPRALGYRVQARLWMSVRPSGLVAVAETLATHPEVSFVGITTGTTNLMAEVICRDTADLYSYLTEQVSSLHAIQTMETAPVMRTLKRIASSTNVSAQPSTSAAARW